MWVRIPSRLFMRKKRIIKCTCKECGEKFDRPYHRFHEVHKTFCSRLCASRYNITYADKRPAYEDKEKQIRANGLINMRVRRGALEKPQCCEECKQKKKLDAHHPDYDFPDQVVWLCRSCHMKEHCKEVV